VDITELFAKGFGYPPEVVASAPGRVNLIGEHIDYSEGFVLPFAIDAVTKCAIAKRDDGKIRIISAQKKNEIIESNLEAIAAKQGSTWSRYIYGVIWAMEIETGLDIYIDGKVPLGAGLSSSAALECSLATALNHLFHLEKTLPELARLTQRAENDYVGVPCGIMDQSISLMARAGYGLLLDCQDLSTRHIKIDFASKSLRLLIIDTQAHHALTDGGYAKRRESCEEVAKIFSIPSLRQLSMESLLAHKAKLSELQFKRARHGVSEMLRVLDAVKALEAEDFEALGQLLNQSHNSLRDDYEVSCPELDLAVETALRSGALGARMVGGGFGGSAIALIKESDAGTISSTIERAFAKNGFKAPRFFDSLPSDGAKVIS
jgi:galactokinase